MPEELQRLRALCEALVRRAESEPAAARALADGVARLLEAPPEVKPTTARRSGRRAAPILDPFEIYRTDPAMLRARLAALDLERLRDVVAHYGMDSRRLVMKWKTPERVVEHIAETVEARSRKGDAFRAPSPQ